MDQYAIFVDRNQQTMRLDISKPFGAAKLSDGEVTLTGTRAFIKSMRDYFTWSPGWISHLESDEPFVSMVSKTTMGNMIAYKAGDGAEQYDTAIASLQGEILTENLGKAAPRKWPKD